jgi:hypothetical protein
MTYGLALVTSTSEKSEQYFWYLTTPAWIMFLAAKAMYHTRRCACAAPHLLGCHQYNDFPLHNRILAVSQAGD